MKQAFCSKFLIEAHVRYALTSQVKNGINEIKVAL